MGSFTFGSTESTKDTTLAPIGGVKMMDISVVRDGCVKLLDADLKTLGVEYLKDIPTGT